MTTRTFCHVSEIQRTWLDGEMIHTLYRDGEHEVIPRSSLTYISEQLEQALVEYGSYAPGLMP